MHPCSGDAIEHAYVQTQQDALSGNGLWLGLRCDVFCRKSYFPFNTMMMNYNCHLKGSHVLLNLRRLGLHDSEESGDTGTTAIAFNSRSQAHRLDTALRTASDTTTNDTLELKERDVKDKSASTSDTTLQVV